MNKYHSISLGEIQYYTLFSHYESVGRRFESCWARHCYQGLRTARGGAKPFFVGDRARNLARTDVAN